MILILSSFVAASPVGGGAQVLALAGIEVESVLAPTVLFGRHPGLGPPGGGAVDPALFAGVLAGIEADGVFARADAVITGYFAHPDQVASAARDLGRPVLVSSVPVGRGVGVMWTDGREAWIAHHRRAASAPNGTGDLLTALFTAALVSGAAPADALETAVGDVAASVFGEEVDVILEELS
jgi:pyridoxal/pyridoxine/pyridoxamine kinase